MFHKIFLLLIYFYLGTSFIVASYQDLMVDLREYHGISVSYPHMIQHDVVVSAKTLTFSLLDSVVEGVGNTFVTYKDLSVQAYRFWFSSLDNSLKFFNNVVVNRDDMSLVCNTGYIKFPYKVSVLGDVKLSYHDYVSISDYAMYNLDKHSIVLKGNARLSNQDDYIRGDHIVFDLKEETVLSGGRSKIKLSTDRFQE